ncbi:MAG: hypothetical protein IJO98_02235 [Clostridia bacterium]|nr:hypothetical protein [Clostridia bacterium]
MTKRKRFSLAAGLLILIAGWNIYDAFFRSYGTETFDDAFLAEFDAVRIVDSIDRLRDTGLFRYQVSDTMEHPQIVATWPADSMLMQSPVCISVQKNSPRYPNVRPGYSIRWRTMDDYAEFFSVSEELSAYKYLYHIHFTVRDGQIRYTQAGNSRRECMAQARENLLWLMSLT